ncbi:MAG: RNA polymerase sigma-70 factor [Cyclobacteriaceae bacterium]
MILKPDNEILSQLRQGDESALKHLFDNHFQSFYKYACRIVNDTGVAEEIVQDVFINLWNKKDELTINISLVGYLKTSVKNRCLNHLKKKYVVLETNNDDHITAVMHTGSAHEMLQKDELQILITKGINGLPAKTKLIFSMSRNLDLSHRQIAEELDITQKGVEYHMTNALRHLRHFLANHGYSLLLVSLAQ